MQLVKRLFELQRVCTVCTTFTATDKTKESSFLTMESAPSRRLMHGFRAASAQDMRAWLATRCRARPLEVANALRGLRCCASPMQPSACCGTDDDHSAVQYHNASCESTCLLEMLRLGGQCHEQQSLNWLQPQRSLASRPERLVTCCSRVPGAEMLSHAFECTICALAG